MGALVLIMVASNGGVELREGFGFSDLLRVARGEPSAAWKGANFYVGVLVACDRLDSAWELV